MHAHTAPVVPARTWGWPAASVWKAKEQRSSLCSSALNHICTHTDTHILGVHNIYILFLCYKAWNWIYIYPSQPIFNLFRNSKTRHVEVSTYKYWYIIIMDSTGVGPVPGVKSRVVVGPIMMMMMMIDGCLHTNDDSTFHVQDSTFHVPANVYLLDSLWWNPMSMYVCTCCILIVCPNKK
jgi:hypothetical protein